MGPPTAASVAAAAGCRVLRGPIELPLHAPAALALRGDVLDIVQNDDGKPHRVSLPVSPVPGDASAPAREPAEGGVRSGYGVACALAGERVFCSDRTGAVRRSARDGSGDRIVASSRTGSRIGAAVLAGSHAALAYLASRQTSEGWVSESWLAVDDEPPVRLSEDGSGATFITLVARGASVQALSVDARAALSALHLRPITFEGKAHLGEDVVLFVGGPGDRRMIATLAAPPAGPGWALLPIARDATTFGVAAVRVDDPPRVDEPVVWSLYLNGLDPAPGRGDDRRRNDVGGPRTSRGSRAGIGARRRGGGFARGRRVHGERHDPGRDQAGRRGHRGRRAGRRVGDLDRRRGQLGRARRVPLIEAAGSISRMHGCFRAQGERRFTG